MLRYFNLGKGIHMLFKSDIICNGSSVYWSLHSLIIGTAALKDYICLLYKIVPLSQTIEI